MANSLGTFHQGMDLIVRNVTLRATCVRLPPDAFPDFSWGSTYLNSPHSVDAAEYRRLRIWFNPHI
jgi:hypothetical protein